MINFMEPLLIVVMVALAMDYRRPEPLLFGRVELAPLLTLEEQAAEEWLASIRVGPLAPNTGGRVKKGGHRAGRHTSRNPFPASHYYRNH